MNKDFSQMTAAELREYAETVQAEYDADEISGPSGRQIVRDAWERVEEAERATQTNETAQHVTATVRFCLNQAQRASQNFITAVANGGFNTPESKAALATLRHYVENAKRLNNR